MAKVLMRTVESWRVDTEDEAQEVIATAISSGGELSKKVVEVKQRKLKGQITDEILKVTVQVEYANLWAGEESI
jgi:hypothetical protein